MTFVLVGSVIAAGGLQFFLLPNHLLDGGVTGISIIAAQLTGWPLGVFLLVCNVPFVILAHRKFGKDFAIFSIIGITMLALLTFAHVQHGFTDVPILAAIFGGLLVGIGAGMAIRYGGIVDGADTIAVLIDRVTIFSVSEAIMAINGIIIALAGFVFGWEQALYSLIAYFVAHKAVHATVQGLDESRSVWVVSKRVHAIGRVINDLIEEPVTYLRESDPESAYPYGVMLAVITRLEEQKVKSAIRSVDPHAYTVIGSAHEVMDRISEDSLHQANGSARI
jgi:uncharacterized membrane-anchored protein YitT (DUF2179 family)